MLRGKRVECKNEYLEKVVKQIDDDENQSVGQSKIEQFFETNNFSQGNRGKAYLQQAYVNGNRIHIDLELIHYHTTGVSDKFKKFAEFLSGKPFNETDIRIYSNAQPFSFDFQPNDLTSQICVATQFLGKLLEKEQCVFVRDLMAVIDMESTEFNKSKSFPDKRTDFTEIITFEEGNQGSWGRMHYCPAGSFATGYSMKTAIYTHVDNTATNGIRLYCEKKSDNDYFLEKIAIIKSKVGDRGYLRASKFCKNSQFLQSFNVRTDKYKESDENICDRDYSAINSISFNCTGTDNNEKIEAPGTMYWGGWKSREGPHRKCSDKNSAICGIQTRTGSISKKDKAGEECGIDNVGLNGVKFACCSLPN